MALGLFFAMRFCHGFVGITLPVSLYADSLFHSRSSSHKKTRSCVFTRPPKTIVLLRFQKLNSIYSPNHHAQSLYLYIKFCKIINFFSNISILFHAFFIVASFTHWEQIYHSAVLLYSYYTGEQWHTATLVPVFGVCVLVFWCVPSRCRLHTTTIDHRTPSQRHDRGQVTTKLQL
jgi:hypothetical protein